MRVARFALVAVALVGVSVALLDAPAALARGAGAAAGGTAGGGTGGAAAGGGGTGAGGAGAGSNPNVAAMVIPTLPPDRHPPRVVRQVSDPQGGSCFKQEALFDRYGNTVVNMHGAECYE
jgi:hypothetical protein